MILQSVQQDVLKTLKRDTPHWHMCNCCPACLYRLEGEPCLKYSMLVCIDGNKSQKRIERKSNSIDDAVVVDGHVEKQKNIEAFDTRDGTNGYFLPREEVNIWSKAGIATGLAAITIQEDTKNEPIFPLHGIPPPATPLPSSLSDTQNDPINSSNGNDTIDNPSEPTPIPEEEFQPVSISHVCYYNVFIMFLVWRQSMQRVLEKHGE